MKDSELKRMLRQMEMQAVGTPIGLAGAAKGYIETHTRQLANHPDPATRDLLFAYTAYVAAEKSLTNARDAADAVHEADALWQAEISRRAAVTTNLAFAQVQNTRNYLAATAVSYCREHQREIKKEAGKWLSGADHAAHTARYLLTMCGLRAV